MAKKTTNKNKDTKVDRFTSVAKGTKVVGKLSGAEFFKLTGRKLGK